MGNLHNILLSTAYFPPLSYYHYLACNIPVLIEQMETFPKQTCRNRCEIMTAAGKAFLVVPVSKPNGNRTLTKDIEICYREPWQRHHWRALESAYSSSPYFSFYADILSGIFSLRETRLIILNQKITETLNRMMLINPVINFTGYYEKNPLYTRDLRNAFSLKKNTGIARCPHYPQVFEHKYGFLPGLSILDLLFNLGPDAKNYLRELAV